MNSLDPLTSDLRVRVRRDGSVPASPRCVVYWMQRAQRARDNPALDTAIRAIDAYIARVERA